MNKYKELELLKETLKEVLMSDELETTLWYLDEFKSLKEKELTDIDRENLLKILNHFKDDSMFLFEEDQENDIITKRELKKLMKKIKEE